MRIHSPQITGSAENTNIVTVTRITSLTALSASFASTASFVQNAQSASFAVTASHLLGQSPTSSYALTASFVSNALSASFAATASSADNLNVRGTLTAQTINVQTITSSIDYVTGSSINGSLLTNTHQFTGSVSVTGSLQVNESNVILTNQTSSMSVATASYWSGSIINAATASYVENAQSASYVQNAQTASYVVQAQSASYWSGSIINSATASYVENAQSASYVLNAQSASYWSGSITNAATASYVVTAQTASYVLNAVSASFALTASYISGSGAGVGFPFSGSAIITGSLFVSGSTISGSFVGDGSGITGLTAGGKIHTQSSAASTWTVSHNLGVQYPNVTVYDNNNNVIIPQTIVATDANTLTLTFGSAVAGYAVAGIGGIINVQGRTTQQYFTASTTWSFAHNLGDKYVSLQAFDDAFEMMIPTTIRLVDFTSSLLLFDSASSGYAVATIGGDLPAISSSYAGYTLQVASSAPYSASWVAIPNVTVTNAVSSSFAATASSADNLTVRGTLTAQTINVQTITSSIEFITGSTRNGTLSTNTHEFTGSVSITGSAAVLLNVNNGVLYVSASGNVGINNVSPTVALDVTGAGKFSGALTLGGNTLLSYSSNTTTANAFPRLGVSNTNATQQDFNISELYVSAGNGAVNGSLLASYSSTFPTSTPSIMLRNSGNGPLYFSTNGAIKMTIASNGNTDIAGDLSLTPTNSALIFSSGFARIFMGSTETMRITSGGEVCVGTTTAGFTAVGRGNITIGGPSTSILSLKPGSADGGYMYHASTSLSINNNSSGGIYMTALSAGVVLSNGATAWASSSDERLKNINSNIENALDKLLSLRAVNFNWKSDDTKKEVLGLIAQDVDKVFPQVVDKSKLPFDINGERTDETEYLNIRYTELVPVLVRAIQELSAENTSLINRIEALENK
jgi:hypothetical protein